MRRLLALLLPLALSGCAGEPAPASGDGEGPAWSFTAIDGRTYSRDEPRGNATVLFFMATWCGSCRTKAPVVADVVDDFREQGLRAFSIGFDPSETAEQLRAWQERYDQPWPHGVDPALRVVRAFDVRSQSTVVVLDAQGHVVEHFGYGQVTDAGLRRAVERALASSA
ncbi:MAG TPA: TlpA disulfide reductase family protein [Candidatus Thermoplasmatota archaeon]|nr:TlpA disulfide reductase family protein [Candidatus Thermoplasmatota archaeon]